MALVVGSAGVGAAVGVGAFYSVVTATTSAIGLTAAGPVSGGLFAGAQAAGLVAAGSGWAGL